MITFCSILFYIAFVTWTLLLGLLALPVLLCGHLARRLPALWIAVSLWLLRVLCGLKVEIRGREHIQAGPAIYAAKHQSALDTLVLWQALGCPVFILKRELLRIPVFGWYLWRTSPIAINRGARGEALKAIAEQGKAKAAAGRPIIIFPEGTRTRPGDQRPYKVGGISVLYEQVRMPIVPVALNTGCFWTRNALRKYPGTTIIQFLPTLPEGLTTDHMLVQLRTQIEMTSEALRLMADAAAKSGRL